MKIDSNTLIPLGLVAAILGGAITVGFFGGKVYERWSQLDPVRIESRLASVETTVKEIRRQVAELNIKMDRLPARAALFFLPHQPINEKTSGAEGDDGNTNCDPDFRHGWPIRLLLRTHAAKVPPCLLKNQ